MFPRAVDFPPCWGAAELQILGAGAELQGPFNRSPRRCLPAAAQTQQRAGHGEQTNSRKSSSEAPGTRRALSGLGFGQEAPQVFAHTYSVLLKQPKLGKSKKSHPKSLSESGRASQCQLQLHSRFWLDFSQGLTQAAASSCSGITVSADQSGVRHPKMYHKEH